MFRSCFFGACRLLLLLYCSECTFLWIIIFHQQIRISIFFSLCIWMCLCISVFTFLYILIIICSISFACLTKYFFYYFSVSFSSVFSPKFHNCSLFPSLWGKKTVLVISSTATFVPMNHSKKGDNWWNYRSQIYRQTMYYYIHIFYSC